MEHFKAFTMLKLMVNKFYDIRKYMLPTIVCVKVGKRYMRVCLTEHKTSLEGQVRNFICLWEVNWVVEDRRERETDIFLNT